jgi:hypothetical protein
MENNNPQDKNIQVKDDCLSNESPSSIKKTELETGLVDTSNLKEKSKKFTKENLRNNPYIITTFVLLILAVSLIISNIHTEKTYYKAGDEMLCSVIYATPAWVIDGRIASYGVVIPENISVDLVGTELIPNGIKFLYSSSCSACESQINYFKEMGTWDAYVNSGLTIDCSKY